MFVRCAARLARRRSNRRAHLSRADEGKLPTSGRGDAWSARLWGAI